MEPQPPPANADVERAAADIRGEAANLLERRADVIRVQVDRGAADRQEIKRRCHQSHLVFREVWRDKALPTLFICLQPAATWYLSILLCEVFPGGKTSYDEKSAYR